MVGPREWRWKRLVIQFNGPTGEHRMFYIRMPRRVFAFGTYPRGKKEAP